MGSSIGITYTESDYSLYYNYLLYGTSVFGNNFYCAYDNSDVNADGIKLHLTDYIYYHRIIQGTADPYEDQFQHDNISVTFTHDTVTQTISCDYQGEIAAIYLVLRGEVTPTFLNNVLVQEVRYLHDDSRTIILVTPRTSHAGFPFTIYDEFLRYNGEGELLLIEIADYNDNLYSYNIITEDHPLEGTPFGFRFGKISQPQQGNMFSIPVTKIAGSEEMTGFDFAISYDTSVMTLTNVVNGSLFHYPGEYEWDALIWRHYEDNCTTPECPSGLIKIMGIASNSGYPSSQELFIEDGTELFYIIGEVKPGYENHPNPISFYWTRCADNSVYFPSGLSMVSDHVYDYLDQEITDTLGNFPGYQGAIVYCSQFYWPRFVNFYSGGLFPSQPIEYKIIIGIDSAFALSGDTCIQLDVILEENKTAIGSFDLNFRLMPAGMILFGKSPADSTVYETEGTLVAGWDSLTCQFSTDSLDEVKITGRSNNLSPFDKAIIPQDGGRLLRLFIHDKGVLPDSALAKTIYVQLTKYSNNSIFYDTLGVEIGNVWDCCEPSNLLYKQGRVTIANRDPGDANADRLIDAGDAIYILNYIFNGGLPPNPVCIGDINQDNNTNLGDVVYMVNYIYYGGAQPGFGCD